MFNLTLKKTIISIIITSFLFALTKIEYDNIKLSIYAYPLFWISIPFVLKYFLFGTPFTISQVLIASLAYTAVVLAFLVFGRFCNWSTDSVLYKNKKDNSLLIVCRRYDCYGTAEDCRLARVRKITKHIKWLIKFEDQAVDSTQWEIIPYNSKEFN